MGFSSLLKVPAVVSKASEIGRDSAEDIPGEVFIMSTEGIGSLAEMGQFSSPPSVPQLLRHQLQH
jgi:hypothetical protein